MTGTVELLVTLEMRAAIERKRLKRQKARMLARRSGVKLTWAKFDFFQFIARHEVPFSEQRQLGDGVLWAAFITLTTVHWSGGAPPVGRLDKFKLLRTPIRFPAGLLIVVLLTFCRSF